MKSEEITEKKKFFYRGKTLEELKKLEVREIAKFLPSRQRRTVLRQFQEIEKFLKGAREKHANNKSIKTHKRSLIIVPQMVGMKLQIHHGNGFTPIIVTEEMIGNRFGEFALTRRKVAHGTAGVGATKGSKSKAKT